MKTYKLFDFWTQVVIMIGGVTYTLIDNRYIFYPYFILGGWQLLSAFIHEFLMTTLPSSKSRRAYLTCLLWLLVIGLISVILLFLESAPLLFVYLFAMLFLSPGIAIWYISICYKEIQFINIRSFVHLK